MNNYPDFKNFNYDNSFINSILNTNKEDIYYEDNNALFNPYDGLIRGNLFKNLYVPYKRQEPYEINPANEQAKMLTDINSLCFAMVDLNLYLDINSTDKDKINLYNNYREKYNMLIDKYEAKFGPITLNSNSLNTYPWSWDDMPWPWDN